jgi:hypothetical protein
MKKLYSLAALGALFYAMPMSANYPIGQLCSNITDMTALIPYILTTISLILVIQALIFHYFLAPISYLKAFLIACIGNLPSTVLGIITTFPNMHTIIHSQIYLLTSSFPLASAVSLILVDVLLIFTTIFLLFRYPPKRLFISSLLSTIIAYVIVAAFIIMNWNCR